MLDANHVKTGKIYYEDAYAASFTAVVVSAEGNDIVLDRTAFFPEEGGQSADTGTLAGLEVVDVRIRDGLIHHIVKTEKNEPESGDAGENRDTVTNPEGAAEGSVGLLSPGDTVSGTIDWERRFSNMQQHSGEHLFSGITHRKYGYDNVGFHLSDREVTLDFSGVIPPEGLAEIEEEVNRAVTANIESVIMTVSGEESRKIDYRSKLDLPGEIRIVTFPGVDACACCAPHVRRTGEIGLLKVISCVAYKGGSRVSILCGARAFRYLAEEHRILTGIANEMTTSVGEVTASYHRMRDEIRDLKEKKLSMNRRLLLLEAERIPADERNAVIFEEEADARAVRETVLGLAEKRTGYAAVFTGNDGDGYSYIIAGGNGADARSAASLLREKFGARGGGKPEMVQGFVHAKEVELAALFRES